MITSSRAKTLCLIMSSILILLAIWPAAQNEVDSRMTVPLTTAQQTVTHNPISITKNADFDNQNWPGVGTEENPYIISDLRVSGAFECIRVENTDVHFIIRNCTLEANNLDGTVCINLIDVEYATIDACTVNDAEWGINLEECSNCSINGSKVLECNTGILLQKTSNSTILDSASFRCNFGLELYQSEKCNVHSNRIFGNEVTGIRLGQYTNNCILSQNMIGWNEGWTTSYNAEDDGHENSWNRSSLGNRWENHNGSDRYVIPGNASSADYHPEQLKDEEAPEVNSPPDITYEAGTTGHEINWLFSDDYPQSIEILRNDLLVRSLHWCENEISIELGELQYGVYNFTIVLSDFAENQTTDTVRVIVIAGIFAGLGTPYVLIASALSVVAVTAFILVMIKMRGEQFTSRITTKSLPFSRHT